MRRENDISDQGFQARSMTIAYSLLIFISVFYGALSLLSGALVLVFLFSMALLMQVTALLSVQTHHTGLKRSIWAFLCSWLALIYGFYSSHISTLDLHILVTFCSFFILPIHKANSLNILAWVIMGVMAYAGRQSISFESILAVIGVVLLGNLTVRNIKTLEHELETRHITDSTTGCLNKDALVTEMEKAWEIYKRYDINASTIKLQVMNLDVFQLELGHNQTNVLLGEIVQVWTSRLRNTDMLCRYDEAQFICLLPNTKQESAESLAADLCKACDEYEFSCHKNVRIQSSVAQCMHEESWESWLRSIAIKE